MNFLLDTHAFIWLDVRSVNLSPRARIYIEDADNRLFVSMVTIWEIQIKAQLGKLELRDSLPRIIEEQRQSNGIQLLPVELNHIYELGSLENHHRDPFDRLLIAQARTEGLPIISRDPNIAKYKVEVVW